ncbi:MAG TPA: ABC transporter ATP-binding protein, partial [Acidimicrobiales bacterium]|nr:ABC transporter ATP-binding protein [Acidimicrobiales bacterium]
MTEQLAGAASPGTAWRSWRLMVGYARPHRWGWSGVFLVTVASTAAALLEPWPMKILADNVLGHRPLTSFLGSLPGAHGGTLLAWVVAAGVVLFALTAGLDALLSYSWTRLGQSMVYDLASDLFGRLQRRSLVASARGSVGDDVARITGDSWVVHTAIDNLLFAPAHALLVTVGMVVLMSRLDPLLAVLAVATAPLMTLSAGIFGGRTRRAGERRRLSESSIQAHVQHALSGLLVIQAFGQEERERGRFSELAGAVIGSRKGTTLADQLNILASGLAATLGGAAVLWVGADHVISGQTTVGALLVFLSYQLTLQSQLKAFPGVYSGYQAARASLVRVTEILDAEVEPPERPGAPALAPVAGHVRLESVVFGYEAGRPVLNGVDLE